MNRTKAIIAGLAVAVALAVATVPSQAGTIGQKAALQAAMQQHIDNTLVDGAYLQLDTATGAVRRLYPLDAHPMVLRMGDEFVLCSNFNDADGREVNVDFYLAREGDTYVVFHAAIDDRAMLQRWMQEGKATRYN